MCEHGRDREREREGERERIPALSAQGPMAEFELLNHEIMI